MTGCDHSSGIARHLTEATGAPVCFDLNFPLGDLVSFSGAIRELHRSNPGRYITSVRCPSPDLWLHNPHVKVATSGGTGRLIEVDDRFMRIARAQHKHLTECFLDAITEDLGCKATCENTRGAIYLSEEELRSPSLVEDLTGLDLPYWVISSGGKFDRTVKWWPRSYYQEVVDHFRGKLLFVQVGRHIDFHPRIEGTIDLRGWTEVRSLIKLIAHSSGVISPITSLMHLAAAVPSPNRGYADRACIVLGGGYEPASVSQYPGHDFLSLATSLECSNGGCWKWRTRPLGDGQEYDKQERLCILPNGHHATCMTRLTPDQIINRIEVHLSMGGPKLKVEQRRHVATATQVMAGSALDEDSVVRSTVSMALEKRLQKLEIPPVYPLDRGIVTLASGMDFVASAWVLARMLRDIGCRLPMMVYASVPDGWRPALGDAFGEAEAGLLGIEIDPASTVRRSSNWCKKSHVILGSPYREVLWLDADSFPKVDPSFLFHDPEYLRTGAVMWPDIEHCNGSTTEEAWLTFGLNPERGSREAQGGEFLFNKERCFKPLSVGRWCNEHYNVFYKMFMGDKDIYRLIFKKLGIPYSMTPFMPEERDGTLFQHDFNGREIFQHRVSAKLSVHEQMRRVKGFSHHELCAHHLADFRRRVVPRLLGGC